MAKVCTLFVVFSLENSLGGATHKQKDFFYFAEYWSNTHNLGMDKKNEWGPPPTLSGGGAHSEWGGSLWVGGGSLLVGGGTPPPLSDHAVCDHILLDQ